jgi:hypothetical protein
MKYLLIALVAIGMIILLFRLFRLVWNEIKKDPIANLVIPAATALLTNLLLWWL